MTAEDGEGAPRPAARPAPRPSWTVRRRIVMTTLLFCAAEIAWLTGWGRDTDLHETIANGVLILAGSVIGTYVFGAVWDDRNVLALGPRPRRWRGPDYPETPDEGAPP